MNQRIVVGIVGWLGWSLVIGAGASVNPPAASTSLAQVNERMAALSVPFVANAGQWDSRAAFGAQTLAGMLFVTTDGRLVYSLPGKPVDEERANSGERTRAGVGAAGRSDPVRTGGWALIESFVGESLQTIDAQPAGERRTASSVSYFIGSDERQHRRNLDTFERIDLGEVFPGINVRLRATGNNVEKIFTVAPQRDPGRIRMRIGGATRLELGAQGELIAHTGDGPVTYTAPIAFQEDSGGRRQPVAVRYALAGESHEYGFALARYDAALPLVIDPLLQSTYLGGAGDLLAGYDRPNAIAIHPASGDIYVAGQTGSTGFPGVSGGALESFAGIEWCAFVSRFSADLKTLRQSTYLGHASGGTQAWGLAVHPVTGDVYVTGATGTGQFPGAILGSSAQPSSGGGVDAFVSRFSADLTTVIGGTYLGAGSEDWGWAIAIHPVSGDVYVAGHTSSVGPPFFPGVNGSAQQSSGGGQDGFVSRLSADLTTLIRSTYLGAAGHERAMDVAIHPESGDIYVTGRTTSLTNTFPGVNGGAQGSYGGGDDDAFVSRFNADLSTLIQSSYLGGAGEESDFTRLAIHPGNGNIYLFGRTSSNPFPGTAGGAQASYGGGELDTFISRFSADLSTRNSSYFGGDAGETAYGIAIHPASGEIYVAGSTQSTNLPGVSEGAQSTFGGGFHDGFIARFNDDLTIRLGATYLGGTGSQYSARPAIHPITDDVYVAGDSSFAATFPGVAGGAQEVFGGGEQDGFVSRLSLDLRAADVTPNALKFAAQSGVPMNVMRIARARITGLGENASVTVSGTFGSSFCLSSGIGCTCDLSFDTWLQVGTLLQIANNTFLCVRHVSAPVPNAARATVAVVGGATAKFMTFTGDLLGICSLDVDGNGAHDALTDGLIVIRALFGLTGTSVTNNAIGGGATRNTWAQIQAYMNGNCGTNFAP